MLQKLTELHPCNSDLLSAASDFLHRDLAAHYRADNSEAFIRNRDVQIGVFLANHMFLQILLSEGIDADLSLGLSLGEYNHLVHIGALDFKSALLLVQERGNAYDAGPRGAMASIFPIALETLEDVVRRVQHLGVLEVVNLNSPKQHVVSGETKALEEALSILEDEHYVQPVIIEKQVPMHCSIFEPVSADFRQALLRAPFQKPRLPYLPNRLGKVCENPSSSTFVELLATHVYRPVLWRKSIDWVISQWPNAIFVEVGPLSVLYNLLDRKWHKNRKFCTDSKEASKEHLLKVFNELKTLVGCKGLIENTDRTDLV